MNKNILKQLNKHYFTKYLSYPKIPPIYTEVAEYWYINNPYLKKMGIKANPNISLQIETYEGWQDSSQDIIVNKIKDIKWIMDANLKTARQHEKYLKGFLASSLQKLTKQQIISSLKKLNKISLKAYQGFSFFVNEYFETTDRNLLKKLPEIRAETSDFIDLIWQSYDKILDFIKKQYKISNNILNSCITDELIKIINGKLSHSHIKTVANRPIAAIAITDEITFLFGKDVLDLNKYLVKKSKVMFSKEIRGSVAYKGIAKGKVVKMWEFEYGNYERLKKQKNFILVTPMTRPEIVPYLKNTKAIITDEGGITCHAAIVSRELKKPCIVGTKIATQVLKDGDLVEVDANQGVVRILKRKK